jgi:succinate dehydrogenase / fumarate reductase iron-sulfur subunit
MPEYTLRIRRYSPESGEAAHWDDFTIDLDGHRSVLDGILQARDRQDGSIGIRCSCRAAICGSCGVRINGKPNLACHTHLDKAAETAPDGAIIVEPMGNMPVLKDLIVDMDAVHWKKVQRVTPWLLPEGDPPEREYIVPAESMIDVTQSMACIQCGACVSDCLSMEVDPLFIGPAALAKAYRFVGDPRDGQQFERLKDLAEDPHGIYDCTHCFNCIEACPKGVAPMSQIVRNIEKNGLLHEADLLPDSYGGKFHPRAVPELLDSLPVIVKALQRGKVTPGKALLHSHKAEKGVKRIFERIHEKDERFELNLYVVGYEDEKEPIDHDGQADAAGSHLPAERSPNQ